MALNVGYGVLEMIGGFIAESQALKADALDFVGDGLVTFLGLLAIGCVAFLTKQEPPGVDPPGTAAIERNAVQNGTFRG